MSVLISFLTVLRSKNHSFLLSRIVWLCYYYYHYALSKNGCERTPTTQYYVFMCVQYTLYSWPTISWVFVYIYDYSKSSCVLKTSYALIIQIILSFLFVVLLILMNKCFFSWSIWLSKILYLLLLLTRHTCLLSNI